MQESDKQTHDPASQKKKAMETIDHIWNRKESIFFSISLFMPLYRAHLDIIHYGSMYLHIIKI